MGFLIKQYAQEHGLQLGALARKLGMPLSNLSAIASGRRSVSLKLLSRISRALRCSVPELFDAGTGDVSVFGTSESNQKLLERERQHYLGQDKGWTHRLMLACQGHYGRFRRKGV